MRVISCEFVGSGGEAEVVEVAGVVVSRVVARARCRETHNEARGEARQVAGVVARTKIQQTYDVARGEARQEVEEWR